MQPSLEFGFNGWSKSIWWGKKKHLAYACDQLSKCKYIWAGHQRGSERGLRGPNPVSPPKPREGGPLGKLTGHHSCSGVDGGRLLQGIVTLTLGQL